MPDESKGSQITLGFSCKQRVTWGISTNQTEIEMAYTPINKGIQAIATGVFDGKFFTDKVTERYIGVNLIADLANFGN